MAGALCGVRVVDFGQYVAGPLAAMLLGDQGASVIRVDPPGGPRFDTPACAVFNRNKRSIVLDLSSDAELDVARRLVERADVVIENFRPGVMSRLGLGPEWARARNPRLVYCSLPGFASDDPRAANAAWEGVVAAATGTYRPHPRTGRPVYTALPISSGYAAFQAALAIAVARGVRERDGEGQRVEVPLFDATFQAIGFQLLEVRGAQGAAARPAAAATGAQSLPIGVGGQLQCRDGRWVMYMGGNLRARAFLEASGAAAFVDRAHAGEIDAKEVRSLSEALFQTRTALEWEDFAAEIGSECGVCRTSAEWLENPHALASGIVVESTDPVLGPMRGPGIQVRMSETPGSIRSPRSRPDADRASVLAELDTPLDTGRDAPPDGRADDGRDTRADDAPRAANRADAERAAPSELRPALEGIRVLDLCIVLAGPTCGRTLAELGADVIKIDGPTRPIGRFHLDVNRGKRSLLLDLKTPAGRDVLFRLIDSADVLLQNFRNGVADRLGFGYEAVRARRPDIVYASMNYAGQSGPYAGRPGHEQIAQAVTGMQERLGGDGKPRLQPFAVNDYATGIMGAYAVALALLHRQQTGCGQHVDTALAYTATTLQSAVLQSFAGKVWDEPRGPHTQGSGPLHRAYASADGWIFFAARPADLARDAELSGLLALEPAAQERALEAVFAKHTTDEWTARLAPLGIGCHRLVIDPAELRRDPWVQAHGLVVTREHREAGSVTTNGPSVRLSGTPLEPGRPASPPGADAASVLAEIGLGGELDRLVADGVIATELRAIE